MTVSVRNKKISAGPLRPIDIEYGDPPLLLYKEHLKMFLSIGYSTCPHMPPPNP